MPRILEYVEEVVEGSQRRYRCDRCGKELGHGEDYRELAASYDQSINDFEPSAVNTARDIFVLRHHCCPHCGVLFEIEMIPRGD